MNKTSSQVALVAGSSGIVGRQLVNTLLHRGWEVIGLSHRALSQPGAIPMIHVDLRDARHSAQALQPLSTVTHCLPRVTPGRFSAFAPLRPAI